MHIFQSFIPALEHFRLLGYWLVFLIALLESVAFVGLLVPGTVFLILIGFLASEGYFDPGDVVWFAAAGAIVGDAISYRMGKNGKKFFHEDNKIFKISYLIKGEQFFTRHGNKSVFLGRFLGPVRPIIPFVAGLTKMDKKRFFFWNILSALLWAALYVFLGYFFGHTVGGVRLLVERLGKLFLFMAAAVLVFYFLRRFFVEQGKQLVVLFRALWQSVVGEFRWATGGGKRLLGPSIMIGCALIAFAVITWRVTHVQSVLASDQMAAAALSDLKAPGITQFFAWLTQLGSALLSVALALALGVMLWRLRRAPYIAPLVVSVLGSGATTFVLKHLIERPRPVGGAVLETSFSFPSGHATIVVALFGFLAFILWRELRSWPAQVNALFACLAMMFVIGFSRLYLQVHWLSDVVAGYLVGLVWLCIAIIIFRLREESNTTL